MLLLGDYTGTNESSHFISAVYQVSTLLTLLTLLHPPTPLPHPEQPSLPPPPSHRPIPHRRGAPERELLRPLEHRREIPTPVHVPPAIDAQVPLHHGGGLERGIRRAPDGLPEVVEAVGHVAHADGLAVDGGVDALAEHVLVGSAGEKKTGRGKGDGGDGGELRGSAVGGRRRRRGCRRCGRRGPRWNLGGRPRRGAWRGR